MKLNHKIKINLVEFIKTGKFDYVTLGKTKDWMTNNFPEPDFKHHFNKSTTLWGFGNIEIYFTNNEVSFINLRNIHSLVSGSHIELDKSIFENSNENTLSVIQNKINEFEIDYQIKHLPKLEQVIINITKSNVELGFGTYEDNPKKEHYELLFITLVSQTYFKY